MHGDEVTIGDLQRLSLIIKDLRHEMGHKIKDLENQLRKLECDVAGAMINEQDARRSAIQEVWNTLGNDAKVTGMEDDE